MTEISWNLSPRDGHVLQVSKYLFIISDSCQMTMIWTSIIKLNVGEDEAMGPQ